MATPASIRSDVGRTTRRTTPRSQVASPGVAHGDQHAERGVLSQRGGRRDAHAGTAAVGHLPQPFPGRRRAGGSRRPVGCKRASSSAAIGGWLLRRLRARLGAVVHVARREFLADPGKTDAHLHRESELGARSPARRPIADPATAPAADVRASRCAAHRPGPAPSASGATDRRNSAMARVDLLGQRPGVEIAQHHAGFVLPAAFQPSPPADVDHEPASRARNVVEPESGRPAAECRRRPIDFAQCQRTGVEQMREQHRDVFLLDRRPQRAGRRRIGARRRALDAKIDCSLVDPMQVHPLGRNPCLVFQHAQLGVGAVEMDQTRRQAWQRARPSRLVRRALRAVEQPPVSDDEALADLVGGLPHAVGERMAVPSAMLDILRDEATAVRCELGVEELDRAHLLESELAARSGTHLRWRASRCCCRSMASARGSPRSHAAAAFCVASGSGRASRDRIRNRKMAIEACAVDLTTSFLAAQRLALPAVRSPRAPQGTGVF